MTITMSAVYWIFSFSILLNLVIMS